MLATLAQAMDDDVTAEAIGFFVHGGTTVINAITERKGVATALLTTRGLPRRAGDRARQPARPVQPSLRRRRRRSCRGICASR